MTLAEVGKKVLDEFGDIPGVELVSVSYTTLPVTVIIKEESDQELRYVIYDLEWEFMRRYPEIRFDWHVQMK